LLTSAGHAGVTADDRNYLVTLTSAETGLARPDAERAAFASRSLDHMVNRWKIPVRAGGARSKAVAELALAGKRPREMVGDE
jgi:hypothetical protein